LGNVTVGSEGATPAVTTSLDEAVDVKAIINIAKRMRHMRAILPTVVTTTKAQLRLE
jgi:hypothetical protein